MNYAEQLAYWLGAMPKNAIRAVVEELGAIGERWIAT